MNEVNKKPKLKIKKKIVTTEPNEINEYDKLSLEEFAIKSHKDLVTATNIMKDEDNIDLNQLKMLLAKYPYYLSTANVEYRLMKAELLIREENFNFQMSKWYTETSEELGSKATKTAINSKIQIDNKIEIKKLKDNTFELEQKVKLSLQLKEQWGQNIFVLQALSKIITTELLTIGKN